MWSRGQQFGAGAMTVRRNGRCTHSVLGPAGGMQIVTPPTNGRIEGGGGSLTYVPNPGFAGSDSYVFSANRPEGGRISVTVNVTVSP
jgi:hypothetical protein